MSKMSELAIDEMNKQREPPLPIEGGKFKVWLFNKHPKLYKRWFGNDQQ